MSTPYNKQLLDQIISAFQEANGHEPFSRSEAAAWAIQHRLWDPPMRTKVQLLGDELATAMGTARASIGGRKVRQYHCVQQQLDDGTQQTLWCHVDIATPEFLEQSLARRRRSLRNQNIQLHNDVFHINQLKGMNIQLLFDYSDDIADYEHELGEGGDTSDQDDLTDPEG